MAGPDDPHDTIRMLRPFVDTDAGGGLLPQRDKIKDFAVKLSQLRIRPDNAVRDKGLVLTIIKMTGHVVLAKSVNHAICRRKGRRSIVDSLWAVLKDWLIESANAVAELRKQTPLNEKRLKDLIFLITEILQCLDHLPYTLPLLEEASVTKMVAKLARKAVSGEVKKQARCVLDNFKDTANDMLTSTMHTSLDDETPALIAARYGLDTDLILKLNKGDGEQKDMDKMTADSQLMENTRIRLPDIKRYPRGLAGLKKAAAPRGEAAAERPSVKAPRQSSSQASSQQSNVPSRSNAGALGGRESPALVAARPAKASKGDSGGGGAAVVAHKQRDPTPKPAAKVAVPKKPGKLMSLLSGKGGKKVPPPRRLSKDKLISTKKDTVPPVPAKDRQSLSLPDSMRTGGAGPSKEGVADVLNVGAPNVEMSRKRKHSESDAEASSAGVSLQRKKKKKSLRWADGKSDGKKGIGLESVREIPRIVRGDSNREGSFSAQARTEKERERRERVKHKESTEQVCSVKPTVEWKRPRRFEVPEEDLILHLAIRGEDSMEKNVQHDREKKVLAAQYFEASQIPDSPAEPNVGDRSPEKAPPPAVYIGATTATPTAHSGYGSTHASQAGTAGYAATAGLSSALTPVAASAAAPRDQDAEAALLASVMNDSQLMGSITSMLASAGSGAGAAAAAHEQPAAYGQPSVNGVLGGGGPPGATGTGVYSGTYYQNMPAVHQGVHGQIGHHAPGNLGHTSKEWASNTAYYGGTSAHTSTSGAYMQSTGSYAPPPRAHAAPPPPPVAPRHNYQQGGRYSAQ